jgi:hypothetical protein
MEAKKTLLPCKSYGSARAPCHGERCSLSLLLTPPKSAMIPPVSPAKSPATTPRLGCADAVERWDTHKNRAGSPSPSSLRPASSSPRRTSSCDRWNTKQEEHQHHVGDGMTDGRSHYRSWLGAGDDAAVMPSLVGLSPYLLHRWCLRVAVGKTSILPCYNYS